MSKTRFDDVIVGGGVAGLSMAAGLLSLGRKVLLLDSGEQTGGSNRESASPVGQTDYGLKLVPDTDVAQNAIAVLESLIGESITDGIIDSPPLTFLKGQLQPFVGFGSQAPEYVDELSYYTQPRNLRLRLKPHQWVQRLRSNTSESTKVLSLVTRFEVREGRIHSAVVNGTQHFEAEHFFFCGAPESLPTLLPSGTIPAKAIQKLAQAKTWTSVGLNVVHSHAVSEKDNIHVLYGGTENAQPCVGRFEEPTVVGEKIYQLSYWLTFLTLEKGNQEEDAGQTLREIKRQMKRAYPDALNNPVAERITVTPASHGQLELKLQSGGRLPQLENLFVIGRGLSNHQNLIGILSQCQNTLHQVGYRTPEAPKLPPETAPESFDSPHSLA